jgi:hypothetical protein
MLTNCIFIAFCFGVIAICINFALEINNQLIIIGAKLQKSPQKTKHYGR